MAKQNTDNTVIEHVMVYDPIALVCYKCQKNKFVMTSYDDAVYAVETFMKGEDLVLRVAELGLDTSLVEDEEE